MLNLLDVLIRDLFLSGIPGVMTGIPGFTLPGQVRFQPPDATLRTDVVNLNRRALCLYLVDLRENRKLRTNERLRVFDAIDPGLVNFEPAPSRMDCHYLLTAWTPTQPAPGVEPTLEEHQLLYQAVATLMQAGSLNPSRVYAAGSAPLSAWPARFRGDDFPTVVLPVEGFAKLSEFWTTMGQNSPWRPVVHLIVTLPVALLQAFEGPMVTTVFGDYRLRDVPASAELFLNVGGFVRRTVAGVLDPIAGAWVQLETLAGDRIALVHTDARGGFTFERLQAMQYRLIARADGLAPDQVRVVDVPSETGEYDLTYP